MFYEISCMSMIVSSSHYAYLQERCLRSLGLEKNVCLKMIYYTTMISSNLDYANCMLFEHYSLIQMLGLGC